MLRHLWGNSWVHPSLPYTSHRDQSKGNNPPHPQMGPWLTLKGEPVKQNQPIKVLTWIAMMTKHKNISPSSSSSSLCVCACWFGRWKPSLGFPDGWGVPFRRPASAVTQALETDASFLRDAAFPAGAGEQGRRQRLHWNANWPRSSHPCLQIWDTFPPVKRCTETHLNDCFQTTKPAQMLQQSASKDPTPCWHDLRHSGTPVGEHPVELELHYNLVFQSVRETRMALFPVTSVWKTSFSTKKLIKRQRGRQLSSPVRTIHLSKKSVLRSHDMRLNVGKRKKKC